MASSCLSAQRHAVFYWSVQVPEARDSASTSKPFSAGSCGTRLSSIAFKGSSGSHVLKQPPAIVSRERLRPRWQSPRRTAGLCRAEKRDAEPDGNKGGEGPEKREAEPPVSDREKGAESEKKDGPFAGIQVSPVWKKEPTPGPVLVSKADIEMMRNQVFGFDTFFVTSQEAYGEGVLFNGNLRGDSAKAFEKLTQRLKEKFGEQYKLFLLEDPEDDRPVVTVLPAASIEPVPSGVPEWAAAAAFGLTSVFTLLLRNTEGPEFVFLPTLDYLTGPLLEGALEAALMAAVLAAHEIGHLVAAKRAGLQLSLPFFIPSWQLGSFGAITRIKGVVTNRQQLAEVAAAGPLAGSALALALILVGLLLPPGDAGVLVESSAFHDSILVGGLAKLVLGDALQEGASVVLSPMVLAAWAGLLINAINCIPAGELDGGRLALALWGRKVASRLTALSLALLGLSGIFDDVALYWVALIIFLQRGPILPQADAVTPPDSRQVALGAATLVLGLLVLTPLPVPFS